MFVVVSGEESDEEEGQEGVQETSLKAQQTQLEAEKQAILQNKELLEEVCVLDCTVSLYYICRTHLL